MMTGHAMGKIFLADERGREETIVYRTLSTFNFSNFFNQYKIAFGRLYVLNNNTLAAKHQLGRAIEKDSLVLLLPVAGDINYLDNRQEQQCLKPGELLHRSLKKGDTFSVTNPYEGELINYIEIWITADNENTRTATAVVDFDVDKNRNLLLPLTSPLPAIHASDAVAISIGKFDGRKDACYHPTNSKAGIFAFAIQGVFEVQGRLLQTNDGLALWNEPGAIEMESLSNDAIVLLIDFYNP
jgi:hypothetical protein